MKQDHHAKADALTVRGYAAERKRIVGKSFPCSHDTEQPIFPDLDLIDIDTFQLLLERAVMRRYK